MTTVTASAAVTLMGFDFLCVAEVSITYEGCPARTYGPPEDCYPAEDPEWQVLSITLERDEAGWFGPTFEATGKLFCVLEENPDLQDAIYEAVTDEINEERWLRKSRRVWRSF